MQSIKGLVAILVTQGFLVGSALAQDGFVWTYDRYLDPDPFKSRLSLGYAIPETDAIQFVALCQIGNRGTYAAVDIGNLPNGSSVDIRFLGRNFNHTLTGDVIGVNAEVGITGVSIAVDLDDPLWEAIRVLPEIAYAAGGFDDQSLGLRGSSDPTGQFLAECRNMPAPDEVAVVPPPPGSEPFVACEPMGSLRTTETGAPATIKFVNETDGFRSVMWIDGEGMPQPYGNLNPGESYVQSTFVGHVWMMTDGPGNCLEIHRPVAGPSTFAITAPNVDFGPE